MHFPNHWKPAEFFPRSLVQVDTTWQAISPELWTYIDYRILLIADLLVVQFGGLTVNNYCYGGPREWCGIRLPECPEWSQGSEHSALAGHPCAAGDFHSLVHSAEYMRQFVLSNQDLFPLIGGIELGVDWLHVDCRSRVNNKIVTFSK